MLLADIYHPPYATAKDNNNLYNHVQATVDLYSLEHPECLICVVGDFNPNSTNISPAPFKRMCGLTQIVKVFTRDTGILDWCLTNSPKVFSLSMQLPKIGASDHYSVLVAPVIPSSHSSKLTLLRRDTRPSHIRDFGGWITSFVWDWTHVRRSLNISTKISTRRSNASYRFDSTVFIAQISHG